MNVELAHQQIKGFFEAEFKNRINGVLNTKIKNSTLNRVNKKNYTPEQQKLHDQFEAEATEDAKK